MKKRNHEYKRWCLLFVLASLLSVAAVARSSKGAPTGIREHPKTSRSYATQHSKTIILPSISCAEDYDRKMVCGFSSSDRVFAYQPLDSSIVSMAKLIFLAKKENPENRGGREFPDKSELERAKGGKMSSQEMMLLDRALEIESEELNELLRYINYFRDEVAINMIASQLQDLSSESLERVLVAINAGDPPPGSSPGFSGDGLYLNGILAAHTMAVSEKIDFRRDYGAYTYVIYNGCVSRKIDELCPGYVQVKNLLVAIGTTTVNISLLRERERQGYGINVFVVPGKKSKNVDISELHNYNGGLSRKLAVGIAERIRGDEWSKKIVTKSGPFLLTLAEPYSPSYSGAVLAFDLSEIHAGAVATIVADYTQSVFRQGGRIAHFGAAPGAGTAELPVYDLETFSSKLLSHAMKGNDALKLIFGSAREVKEIFK